MRPAVPFSNWWKPTSWSWVAEYIATGTETRPKVIAPVQIGRAMRVRYPGNGFSNLRWSTHIRRNVGKCDSERHRPPGPVGRAAPFGGGGGAGGRGRAGRHRAGRRHAEPGRAG